MNFYRLIKPKWAKRTLDNGEPNAEFRAEIEGPNTFEGVDFSEEFLAKKNGEGYNIYFFPNHPSKNVYEDGVRSLNGHHVDVWNYVFVDMDLKDEVYKTKEEFLQVVAEFPLKPTFVVDSGNGIHVYWQITDLTRNGFVYTQQALINHFKTDPSIYTTLQLMRFPGYHNTKRHGDYVLCQALSDQSAGLVYSISEFPQNMYGVMPPKSIERAQLHIDRMDGKLTVSTPMGANMDELPESFLEFINDPNRANKTVYDLFYNPQKGQRSSQDMSLTNILYKAGFNRKEALAVLANTQKALEKGASRYDYAQRTVNRVYVEKLNTKFKTVQQILKDPNKYQNLGELVRGTYYFDSSVLGQPWRKKELIGLIAGAGVGKTTVTLKWIKDSIENNPHNDDISVFFSLEMSSAEIAGRWKKLVGEHSPLGDRLYVIDKTDERGEPRLLGLQEIHEDCQELMKCTGKKISIVAIDHIGIVDKHINMNKPHTFGVQSEIGAGWGDMRQLGLASLAKQMKPLAKMIDALIIVLTQTTKGKGTGNIAIGKDGAYGISDYENIMDRIITIWQPLQDIQSQTKLRFMAWQYVKIREKHKDDKIQCFEPKLLTFNLENGDLQISNKDEYAEFVRLLPEAIAIHESKAKNKATTGYSIHANLGKVSSEVSAHLNNNSGGTNAVGQVQSDQHAGTHTGG